MERKTQSQTGSDDQSFKVVAAEELGGVHGGFCYQKITWTFQEVSGLSVVEGSSTKLVDETGY